MASLGPPLLTLFLAPRKSLLSGSQNPSPSRPHCGHTGETLSFPALHDPVNPRPLSLGTKPSSWSRPLSAAYSVTKQSSRLQRALQQVLPTRGSSSSHRRGAGSCLLLPGSMACPGNALNTGFHGKPGAWLLEVGRQLSQPGPSSETWPLAHTFRSLGGAVLGWRHGPQLCPGQGELRGQH